MIPKSEWTIPDQVQCFSSISKCPAYTYSPLKINPVRCNWLLKSHLLAHHSMNEGESATDLWVIFNTNITHILHLPFLFFSVFTYSKSTKVKSEILSKISSSWCPTTSLYSCWCRRSSSFNSSSFCFKNHDRWFFRLSSISWSGDTIDVFLPLSLMISVDPSNLM